MSSSSSSSILPSSCSESSSQPRCRSGSRSPPKPKMRVVRRTGKTTLVQPSRHVRRRTATSTSATPTMMLVTMSFLLVFFLASSTVPVPVNVNVTVVEAKKISSSSSKASPSTPAARNQSPNTIDFDENYDDDENDISSKDLSSYDNSRRRGRRRRRRNISDSTYSDSEDNDEDDDARDFSCDSRASSYDDGSYHRDYDEYNNDYNTEEDNGLLDDEAEAILQALEKSEQKQPQPQRRKRIPYGSSLSSRPGRRLPSPSTEPSLVRQKKKKTMRKQQPQQEQKHSSRQTSEGKSVAASTPSPSSPRRKKKSKTFSALSSPSTTTMNSSTPKETVAGTKLMPKKKTSRMNNHAGRSSGLLKTPVSMSPSSASSSSTAKQSSPSVIATSKTRRGHARPTSVVSMPTRTKIAAPAATTTTPWIRKFLQDRPDDKLLCIPKDFIGDNFNLSQLPPIIERIGYHVMGPAVAPTVAKTLKERRQQLLAANREAAAAAAGQQQNATTKSGGATSTTGSTKQFLPKNSISGSKNMQNPTAKPSQSALISQYPIYKSALKLILSDSEYDDEDSREELTEGLIPFDVIQVAAEALYSFIHARFITSPRGLESVRQLMLKDRARFGKCPRPMCCGTGTIPYGHTNSFTTTPMATTDTAPSPSPSALSATKCHRYCPSCGEVWMVWDSRTSGCAWGPSFCHLLLLAHGSQIYETELQAIAESNRRISSRGSPFTTSSPVPSQSRPTPGMVQDASSRSPFSPRKLYDYLSSGPPTNSNNFGPRYSNDEGQSSPRPTSSLQSIYGFEIHPGTTFGRPWRMVTNNNNSSSSNEHSNQQRNQQQTTTSTSTTANLNARGGARDSNIDMNSDGSRPPEQ
mmetsp:Transcript_10629/g.25344  ORF Transcript_10629/g.25344 Transcript_10629/m.25344 type:complete len:862 (-) Transcript_10629:121-2706(-)